MINFKTLLVIIIIILCFIFFIPDIKYTIQINEKMSSVQKPIKILRIGMTESTLLFIYWCEKDKKMNFREMKEEMKDAMIRWFYTTSGYYDKSIKGNYFNAEHGNSDPEIYIKYFDKLLEFFINADYLCLLFHIFNNEEKIIHENKNIIQLKEEFKKYINNNILKSIPAEIIYDFIKEKNILIISPFSPLVKQQIDTGNCKKIYNNFPNIKNVFVYRHMYTFFNDGPNQNIFQTCDKIFNDIIQLINTDLYDSVIISCGAYSNLYADKFFNLKKNVCTIGGELHDYFGIMNNRNRNSITTNQEYWINYIPDEYKPEGYMKIEDGCYW